MVKNKIYPAEEGATRRLGQVETSGDVVSIPRGVPLQSVVKVSNAGVAKARAGNDVRFSSNKLSVKGSEFDVDFVFGSEAGCSQIFERSVKPMMKALCEGVSVAVIVLGSSGSEKSTYSEKMLNLTVQEMFSLLGKGGGASTSKKRSNTFQMKVRAFEIFDEIVQDLFNAENRDLAIGHDPLHGNQVSQSSVRGPYRSLDDVMDVLVDSFNSRTSAMSDFGPASRHTNTIWQIDLLQELANGKLRSRIIFAEIASTDKLTEERSTVRAREGPTLSKSLMMFQSVTESFARREQDYAAFGESKLTQILEDALAGNSITVCVSMVRQGESEISCATAGLAQMLRQGFTYPTVNDERVQGLVRRYRMMVNRLRDELSVAVSQGGKGIGGGALAEDLKEMTLKLHDLEGRVVKDNLEKLRMKEEKEKIYEKLVEFREKYNKLVEQKSSIQASNIKGEEEKLKISKALLDLRIENNKLVERCEAEKYELVTKLLNAENEVLQYEMKQESFEKNSAALKQELQDAKRQSDEFKNDLIQLKESYSRIESQFKEELTKNEELGVELLTLVNQKNALHKEAEELRKERAKLQQESETVDSRLANLLSEKSSLEDSLSVERQLTEELKADKLKAQLELQRKEVEFETQRLDFEKNASDFNRERDSEVSQLKARLESELKRNEAQRTGLESDLKDLKAAFKSSTRRTKELEAILAEKKEELNTVRNENVELNEKLTAATEEYRGKLLELLNPSSSLNLDDDELRSTSETSMAMESADRERENLQNILVQTFKDREQDLEKKLKDLRGINQKIVEKNRMLTAKYTSCKSKLEDLEVDIDKIEVRGQDADLQVATSQIEEQLRHEAIQVRQKLEKMTGDLQSVQEKNVSLAASVKRIHRENEIRLGELNAEIKMLERQKANLEEENHNLSQRGGSGMDAETAEKMQEIQDRLLEKIEDLQSSKSQPISAEMQLKVVQLEQQNADFQARLSTMKNGNNQEEENYGELLTRATVAETELDNYKKYMKAALAKSHQQITKLKQERDFFKKKAEIH